MASSEAIDDRQPSFDVLSCDGAAGRIPGLPLAPAQNVKSSCQEEARTGGWSCKHPEFGDILSQGEGFDIRSKQLKGNNLSLSRYILIPDRISSNLPLNIPEQYVLGARIQDIAPSATRHSGGSIRYSDTPPKIDTNYLNRNAFKGHPVVLLGSGPDPLIEGLNTDKDEIGLYPAIESMGFKASTPPDFSVKIGACYAAQLNNINRSLVVAREMEKSGIQVIPNVYATDDYLKQEFAALLNEQAGIGTISINCQLQRRRKEDRKELQEEIIYFLENVHRDLHILLLGYRFTPEDMEPIQKYFSRLHFVESFPFILPRNHYMSVFDAKAKRLWRKNYKARNRGEKIAMIEASIRARAAFLASFEPTSGSVTLSSPILKKKNSR